KTALEFQKRGNSKVFFTFLGGGADEKRLKQQTDSLKVKNVQFLPRVEGSEVVKYLNSADALLVHLKNTSLFQITIPSKILSYLRTGKPILLGLKGNAAEILEESKAGFLFEPENPMDLVNKIDQLLIKSKEERSEMGKKGIQYYDNHLSITS